MIDPALLPAPGFTAAGFTLFQSHLTPAGAVHTPVATFAA
jgi:2'-5' RNA ligase